MILQERRDRVAVLTLDRPDKHNALNTELCRALHSGLAEAVADGARAIVLTGNGRSFCAGADLDEVYTAEFRAGLYALLHAVTEVPVPVFAAIHGAAIGGGTQLAVAADFRVVAPDAVFGVPTAKLGVAVDPWTIRRLAQVAGDPTARALVLACEQFDAPTALARGLADRAGTLETAVDWAQQVAALAPLTIAYSKAVLNDPEQTTDPRQVEAAFDACWASEDFAEARRARAERRTAQFVGR